MNVYPAVIGASWDIERNVEKVSELLPPALQLREFFIVESNVYKIKCFKCSSACVCIFRSSSHLFVVILLAEGHPWPQSNGQSPAVNLKVYKDDAVEIVPQTGEQNYTLHSGYVKLYVHTVVILFKC